MTSKATAVGRLLQPKHAEPRILHRIRRDPITGKLSIVARMILQPRQPKRQQAA